MNKLQNRPLGTNEKVFWVLDQKITTHFAVVAEIDGNTTDRSWREALDAVQHRHPNLSVQIEGDEYSTAEFKHVDDLKIPLRIVHAKEQEKDWKHVVEEELCMPFNSSIAPLVRAVLIQQSGTSVFLFLSNHSIGDGMSIALVIRDILSVLSGRTIGDLMPIPSLDELAGAFTKAVKKDKTQDSLHITNSLVPKPAVNVDRIKLSVSLTTKLIERSKSEQTTVHGALTAAIVLALKRIDASWLNKPVRILHPLSARTTLNIGDDYGLLMNIITLPYSPSPEHTFWCFANDVRKGIALTQTSEWIAGDTNAAKELFSNGLNLNTVESALHQATAHEVMLTNLGQISFSSDFGGLKLKSLWGPMVLTPHKLAQTVGVATFNGELTLTLTGLTPSKLFLEAVKEIIEKVCSTEQDIQIGELYKHPLIDLVNI